MTSPAISILPLSLSLSLSLAACDTHPLQPPPPGQEHDQRQTKGRSTSRRTLSSQEPRQQSGSCDLRLLVIRKLPRNVNELAIYRLVARFGAILSVQVPWYPVGSGREIIRHASFLGCSVPPPPPSAQGHANPHNARGIVFGPFSSARIEGTTVDMSHDQTDGCPAACVTMRSSRHAMDAADALNRRRWGSRLLMASVCAVIPEC